MDLARLLCTVLAWRRSSSCCFLERPSRLSSLRLPEPCTWVVRPLSEHEISGESPGCTATGGHGGIGSVLPWRRKNGHVPKARIGTTEWDEHGVPRCKCCGREGEKVSFSVYKGVGRLWFTCSRARTAACARVQTILCSKSYRDLLPVWRNDPAYAAMRTSHPNFEQKHHQLRTQFLVAGNSLANRPKRVSMRWQQLRATAAVLIEWLRVLQTTGWNRGGTRLEVVTTSGGGMVAKLEAARARRRVADLPSPDAPAPPLVA